MKGKYILIVMSVVLLLTGCIYNAENRQLHRKYSKQAKENAISLFETKYNIIPKVNNVEVGITPGVMTLTSANYISTCCVEVEYEGKTYYAIVDASSKSDYGYDNYQYDQIMDAFSDTMEDIIGTRIDKIYLRYQEDRYDNNFRNGCVSKYFDGSNLDEVLLNYSFNISYSGEKYLDAIKLKEFIDTNPSVYASHIYQFVTNRDSKIYADIVEKGYVVDRHVLYSHNSIDKQWGIREEKYNSYNYGDILIVGEKLKSNEFKINECEMFDTDKIEQYSLDEYEIISNCYEIKSTRKDGIDIYLPTNELKMRDISNLIFCYYAMRFDNEEQYSTSFECSITEDNKYIHVCKYNGNKAQKFFIAKRKER